MGEQKETNEPPPEMDSLTPSTITELRTPKLHRTFSEKGPRAASDNNILSHVTIIKEAIDVQAADLSVPTSANFRSTASEEDVSTSLPISRGRRLSFIVSAPLNAEQLASQISDNITDTSPVGKRNSATFDPQMFAHKNKHRRPNSKLQVRHWEATTGEFTTNLHSSWYRQTL